jgi:hypothetical protein
VKEMADNGMKMGKELKNICSANRKKRTNMANFAMISLPESSENAKSQREMFRGPTKKNFRQIA